MSDNPVWDPTRIWPPPTAPFDPFPPRPRKWDQHAPYQEFSFDDPAPIRLILDEPPSRLIVTLRRNEGWQRALEDLRNSSQFDCTFEGMLEDRLHGVESSSVLPELDHRFAILRSAPGDQFHAANLILARLGGPQGSVIAVEPDAPLFFSLPSVGLNFKTAGYHAQYVADMNVPAAHAHTTGNGIRIAVVDTGADLSAAKDFYDVLAPVNAHPGLPSLDLDGHGTAMATLIHAVAPDAEIFIVRISDSNHTTVIDAMAGVSVAMLDCRAHIVNLSLGFASFGSTCFNCGSSALARSIAFETILRSLALNHSGIYVASAGNQAAKHSEFDYPGAYSFPIVVGSVNKSGDRSRFSQFRKLGGHTRYAMAPGGETDPAGKVTEYVGSGSTGPCCGTSVATAYFSGMLALFRAEPRYNSWPRDTFIDDVLANRCVPHSTGTATEYGHGVIRYS